MPFYNLILPAKLFLDMTIQKPFTPIPDRKKLIFPHYVGSLPGFLFNNSYI